jgi:micrococcal nuclease
MHEYQARVVHVVDGDTLDVVVDLGFNMTRKIRLRLLGIDTHETYGVDHDSTEYKLGKDQTEFVQEWTDAAAGPEWPFIIRTDKKGKYGRYLASVERKDTGADLVNDLYYEFDELSRDENG